MGKRVRDPDNWERCSICRKNKPVRGRDESGNPICASCHKQQQR